MKFKKSKEYPSGAVVITNKDLDILRSKGWVIDLHTPYYANFIGVRTLGMEFGFGAWHTNLEFYISAKNEYGCYYTPDGYEFKINSQETLNKAIAIIDNIILLEKKFKSFNDAVHSNKT